MKRVIYIDYNLNQKSKNNDFYKDNNSNKNNDFTKSKNNDLSDSDDGSFDINNSSGYKKDEIDLFRNDKEKKENKKNN